MFYSQFILAKKGPLGTIWIAAHLERKLRKNQVADTDIGVSVDSILFPEDPIALRLSSHLLLGVVRIYSKKVNYLFDDCSEALLKVKQAFRSAAVDLPPEESTAPYHSITLPETFDLDDFELPDSEIFQGNYVDHHVSTREQITLQDTMDGVVYSTSQFGLDERFGDGDTSQVGLDLDEEVFEDKNAIGYDDEEVPGDQDVYLDAATPQIKDSMVGVSEAMPEDHIEEQVEDRITSNEFIEDAQAPQTPGLVEVPNLSSVREEELACDDHMEAEEGRKAFEDLDSNQMHKHGEDLPSEYNAGESTVTPIEENKSQIDESADAQNEPEKEKAEHVHHSSPCCSHITTETGVDKSDDVPPLESPGEPKTINADQSLSQEQKNPGAENQDHSPIVTEVNQETESSLQVDFQAGGQLDNAQETYKQAENLAAFTDSDLPAPEKVLSAPNELGDGNDFLVESTPGKEDLGTCDGDTGTKNITGKKRTFTESTLTAESLNSVESVGLIQSKRTANSIPDDDDLLSSILVGKPSFLKMKPTPVLEVVSTKRQRLAPRSTASKRKVLMDDPMVLHGDVIRQQLTDTENIRRVRKKAPCTIPEITMLQRQAMEDGFLKEPIFTGMSVELVSLHNEPYDLRGIRVIENEDRHVSAGVVEDNECSVREVEEDKAEECSPPPEAREEPPVEAQTHTQDAQIIDQEREVKDDNEVVEKISDSEALKEDNGVADEVNLVETEEISQIQSEEKLDPVEDLQVEESHEKQDDINEKSCIDVIEIAEGNVDNAILDEAELKVEDEVLLHDEKKTDLSAEVNEIEIDNNLTTYDDKIETGCVEAGDLSNLDFENCNEPIAEVNTDLVNPEMESDEKNQEEINEIANEEAEMRNAVDAEPSSSRDGLRGDNDEMEAMEVAHDTGFLNVDDDEVDEDHEGDDVQDDDETRLLENSGWSSRTRAVAKYLQTLFEKEAENGKNVLVADKLLAGKTRKEASRMFFETLVLKTRDYIQVEQTNPYESITIKPRSKLTKSIF